MYRLKLYERNGAFHFTNTMAHDDVAAFILANTYIQLGYVKVDCYFDATLKFSVYESR